MCLEMLTVKVQLFFLRVSPILERFASVINCGHISRQTETNELLVCVSTGVELVPEHYCRGPDPVAGLVQVSCLLFWKSFVEILCKCEVPFMELIAAVGVQLCACAISFCRFKKSSVFDLRSFYCLVYHNAALMHRPYFSMLPHSCRAGKKTLIPSLVFSTFFPIY